MIRLAESQYLHMMGIKDLYRFFRTIWHWSKLTLKPDYFPEFIWLETTNACNLRCKMCPQSLGNGRPTGTMSDDLFKNIIEQIKGKCYGIFMFFGGDPMCDKKFAERVAYARENGLRVFVHTNAALLTEEKTRELLNARPTTISFSLDTADKPRYEEWRCGAKFEETIKNIRTFIKASKNSPDKPLTIIQLIDVDGSGKRDEAALRETMGNDIPDIFRIRSLHDWAGELSHEVGYKADFKNPYYPCVLLWKALVICWDGRVAACCNDLEGKFIIGDANNNSLKEIWNGEKMVGLRRMLIEGKHIPDLCRDCVNLHSGLGKNPALNFLRTILGGKRKTGNKI